MFACHRARYGIAAAPQPVAQNKAPAEKKIYCWDEGGRKVCGDALSEADQS